MQGPYILWLLRASMTNSIVYSAVVAIYVRIDPFPKRRELLAFEN